MTLSYTRVGGILIAVALLISAMVLFTTRAEAQVVVYTSGSHVDTWDLIFPPSADPAWTSTVCVPGEPAVGLDANWVNPHKAFSFGTGAHPWQNQPWTGFSANWINSWSDLSSRGPGGHSWTRYSTEVTGTGDFVLELLADNCSWIFLSGTLVGFQDDDDVIFPLSRTYPVTLSGTHTLQFIIFDGGGLAGGMYRLETNTGTTFTDTDEDGLADIAETNLHGTDPNDPDSSPTVLVPRQIKVGSKSTLEGLTGNNKHSQKKLDKAIEHLDKSLRVDRWIDGSHLVEKKGKKVFDEEKKAVKHLMKILKDTGKAYDPAIASDVSGVIDRLVNADRLLAEIALEDAKNTPVNDDKNQKKVDHEIEKAEKELDKAQQELNKGKSDKAIKKYKKAWEHAQHAIKHAKK